ncbi:MAG: type 1 glutamine amidotransferase [Pseudomonadota bacterium]
MKILVFQHADCEHPGYFRQLLAEDGHEWTPVELDAGETPPPLDGFDALWVMGGPMDTWQEEEHPWLAGEKALIKEAVAERGMPFLGLCLGHQLLACALGGDCGPGRAEIGVMDVFATNEGKDSPFFEGVAFPLTSLQWHSAEVTSVPQGANVLATSPDCAVQAMSWGPRAFSMQFHMEVEADTVDNWSGIPAYAGALEKVFGQAGVERLREACRVEMDQFNATAQQVYLNWMQVCALTPGMRG